MTDTLVRANVFEALQRAVFTQLRSDPELPSVYDYVPEDARRPYVVFTAPWTAARDGLNFAAERIWFQLSTFSEYRGFLEAAGIDARLVALLRGQRLPLEGGGHITVMGDNAHALRDVDPRIRHIARTFFVPYFYLGRPAVPTEPEPEPEEE